MNIRQKIFSGYACSLGIALFGTSAGLLVGDYYQHQAQIQRQIASRERQLINALQVEILYNRPAKQLTPHLRNKQKFEQESQGLLKRIQSIQEKLIQQNRSGQPAQLEGLQTVLDQYEVTVAEFSKLTEGVFQEISPLIGTSSQGDRAEKLVVKLIKSPEFAAFIEFPDQLAIFSKLAMQREAESELSLEQSEALRVRIIYISLALSIAIAAILAIITSRAIAKPLQALTQGAQQITKDSQFDLYIPIQSQDETGVLANAINNLVQKVQRLLQEQKTYTSQLESAKNKADSANQAKSEFLASMSHELRTPLNGILGYAQILGQMELSEQQARGIKVIHQCGNHLLTLINDVLDLAKIEARKMELYPNPFYLPSMLQGVAEISRLKAEQKNIDFIYDLQASIPKGIIADEKRLRQILLNLLGNAIKFTDSGHVKFKVTAETIQGAETQVQASERGRGHIKLQFAIEDTGVGLDQDQQALIFQPFEQVGAIEHQQQGTGLGLAITQKLLHLMESQVEVSSQLGQGSCFQFELLCPLAQDWTKEQSQTIAGKITGYTGKKRTILVVDDHWENRSIIVNLLTTLGFTLIEAKNGQEALEKLETFDIDLMISDLKMPVLDGWQLLEKVKSSQHHRDLKIIISSASVFSEDRQSSIDAGGDDFLPKPIDVQALYKMLAKYLDINWQYQTAEAPNLFEISSSQKVLGAEEESIRLIPPTDILEELQSLAKKGDLSSLKSIVKHLQDSNPNYQDFIDQLNAMLQRFQLNQARQMLQEALEQSISPVITQK